MWSLFGSPNRLYPFETCVVQAIESHLDSDASARLKAQIASINKVQRLTDGKEVNLYRIAHGKPTFDDRLRFPQGNGESLLGTVHLSHPGNPGTLKVEAWLVNGRLFSLVFDKPPKRFFAGQALRAVRPGLAAVTVWMDPMLGRPRSDEAPVDPATFRGWPRELLTACQLGSARPPLVGQQRAMRIAQIDAQLPRDYLELTEQMDGAQAGACKIHGLANVRKVVLSTDNFYILAEDDGGALAVKDGSAAGELYKLSYEGGGARALNQPFRTALIEFCCRSR